MNQDRQEELLPLVDENGNITGAATRGECHNGSMLLHQVVHLHVFNGKGELYLQKRPEWKDIQPGKWDTAVGGYIDLGEHVELALRREAKEELGLEDFSPAALPPYVFRSERECELVYPFKTVYDGEFELGIYIAQTLGHKLRFLAHDSRVERYELAIYVRRRDHVGIGNGHSTNARTRNHLGSISTHATQSDNQHIRASQKLQLLITQK